MMPASGVGCCSFLVGSSLGHGRNNAQPESMSKNGLAGGARPCPICDKRAVFRQRFPSDRIMDFRERFGQDRIIDVHYAELTENPPGAMRKLCCR
jgi:hypothetical protein